jgi:hypothetical protein
MLPDSSRSWHGATSHDEAFGSSEWRRPALGAAMSEPAKRLMSGLVTRDARRFLPTRRMASLGGG